MTDRIGDTQFAPDARPAGMAGRFLSACRTLTPTEVAWTLAAATAFIFAHSVSRIVGPRQWMNPIVVWEWISVPLWLMFLIAFRVAELPSPSSRPRAFRYAIATALAVVMQSVASLLLLGITAGLADVTLESALWFLAQTSLAGTIAAIVYASLTRARNARSVFAKAELDRALAARRVVTARLSALQAQVEPEFLLGTLHQIDLLCEHEVARADKLLDHLIEFLRDALPQVRGEGTTLGREGRLVGSWLAITKARLDGRLDYAVDIPEALVEQRFHAMLVLPLVEAAIRDGIDPSKYGGRVDVRAERRDDRIVVLVTDAGAARTMRERAIPAELRARLGELYGGNARLAFDSTTRNRFAAVLDVPAEDAR